MSKHTKGPWEIHTAQNGRTIFQIGPCAPEEYAGSAWLDVSMEDARLIAAAPELLEALERLVSDFESEIHNEYDGTSMLSARLAECDYARAAIAKARGEA